MGLVSKVMKFRLLLKIPRGFLSNGIMRVQIYYKGMVCRYVEEAEHYDGDTSFIDLKKYGRWIPEIDMKNYGIAQCVRGGKLRLPDFGVFTS